MSRLALIEAVLGLAGLQQRVERRAAAIAQGLGLILAALLSATLMVTFLCIALWAYLEPEIGVAAAALVVSGGLLIGTLVIAVIGLRMMRRGQLPKAIRGPKPIAASAPPVSLADLLPTLPRPAEIIRKNPIESALAMVILGALAAQRKR